VWFQHVLAQAKPGMKKRLIVVVCGVEMMNQLQQPCPVKSGELGFDIRPGGLRFRLPFGHMRLRCRALSEPQRDARLRNSNLGPASSASRQWPESRWIRVDGSHRERGTATLRPCQRIENSIIVGTGIPRRQATS